MADAFVDQALHLAKKKDHDGLEIYIIKNFEMLSKSPKVWPSIIDLAKADPLTHTMLLAVVGGLRSTGTDGETKQQVIQVTELLIVKGDPKQLFRRDLAITQFRNLIARYTALMRENKEYKRGLRMLGEGMRVFAPTPEHLTVFHSGFVQLCLMMQNPYAAVSVLSVPIYEVDPLLTGVKAVDFMAYYYYGGIAYLALQNIAKAREHFRNVFCVPAQAVSVVMVLAFKALTLINAISEPEVITFPNHVEARHERNIRDLSAPYVDLVNALEARDDATVSKILDVERATFVQDDLVGLVQQALQAAPRQAVLALTRIYVALKLQQIADQVKLPVEKVEALLGTMITRGDIDATIDTTGTVKFGQGSVPQLDDIAALLSEAQLLADKVSNIDDEVIVSRPFCMAKLRATPNLREILLDYEAKRKATRSMAEAAQDMLRGGF